MTEAANKAIDAAKGFIAYEALKKVAEFAKEASEAFAEDERAALTLSKAIENSTVISNSAIESLTNYSEALAKLTGSTVSSVQATEAFLVMSGRSEEQIRKLMQAAADLSTVTGDTLDEAARKLNGTFEGSVKGLDKFIPGMRELTKAQLEAGAGLDLVAKRVQSLSDVLGVSSAVSMKNFGNAWDELMSVFGRAGEITFKPIRNWLTEIMDGWKKAAEQALNYGEAVDLLNKKTASTSQIDIVKAMITVENRQLNDLYRQKDEQASFQHLTNYNEWKAYTMGPDKSFDAYQKARDDSLGDYDIKAKDITRHLTALDGRMKELGNAADVAKGYQPGGDSTNYIRMPNDLDDAMSDKLALRIWQRQQRAINDPFMDMESIIGFASNQRDYAGTKARRDEEAFGGGSIGTGAGSLFSRMSGDAGSSLMDSFGRTELGKASKDQKAEGTVANLFVQLAGSLGPIVTSFTSLNALLNPIQTILTAFVSTIGPTLNALLAPLVGILAIIGQTLGQLLIPVLNLLTPVIKVIADAFIWLYNYIIKPIGNSIYATFAVVINTLRNFGELVANIVNNIADPSKWKGGSWGTNWSDLYAHGPISDINTSSLVAASAAITGSGATPGASANYAQVRPINVYVTVNTDVIADSGGGFDVLVQMISRRMNQLAAAGTLA
jgi:hypothetical protein